jgi:hypothetical protein
MGKAGNGKAVQSHLLNWEKSSLYTIVLLCQDIYFSFTCDSTVFCFLEPLIGVGSSESIRNKGKG